MIRRSCEVLEKYTNKVLLSYISAETSTKMNVSYRGYHQDWPRAMLSTMLIAVKSPDTSPPDSPGSYRVP
jgi:hypothetical protein